METNYFEIDRKFIWHPYTHEKTAQNIVIEKGKGSKIYAEDGSEYIDAISSWWVNLHGHGNEFIAEKLTEQAKTLEHVIFGGFTHPNAVKLAERLMKHVPEEHTKIFFSDNGSTAVEVALKMACQYWHNIGQSKKWLITFKGAYHGDTIGAMSVGERSAFTDPFRPFLFDVNYIDPPVPGKEEESLKQLEELIAQGNKMAFIFEPLVQGTAGMIMHKAEALSKMLTLCKENNILTIADEVATGFGRTGKFFATDHLDCKPDIICMSKGITGGTMALGATTCAKFIYDAFYSSDKSKTFFHGHSYTANPIACAAALASLDLTESESCAKNIKRIEEKHIVFLKGLEKYGESVKTRQIGTIAAMELITPESTSYFNPIRDEIYQYFLDNGVLLRPLGNVIYIFPPYCITDEELDKVYSVIERAIEKFIVNA
jgi:adenosylmethionine-8-amino-7-oxononanoate aminotransferase